MSRQRQLDSEDVQTALAMLWGVTLERIHTCGVYQCKHVAKGVTLWQACGLFYLEANATP